MLTDSLPTNAASSFEMNGHDERALREINAPRGEERRRKPDKIICSRAADANTFHAVSAHAAAGTPRIVRKPSDWMAGSRASLVQHEPSKTVFEIFTRPDMSANAALTLEDFRARLVHRGETMPPTDADIEVLCDEAVLMALFLLGLAWPVAVNPDALSPSRRDS
jgi:hypothetical protein